ncbi:MAG: DUF488 family protein [Planctomycetes bacterium]|nr:DUF488 family protein [Planctomycetota bacterium]
MIRTKRIYDKPARNDGVRVLIDRLWPRGVSKAVAQVDLWLKAIAPSDERRKWFDHDPRRWDQFRQRYAKELARWKDVVVPVVEYLERDHGVVTLLYAAKDEEHNNAAVLRDYLR